VKFRLLDLLACPICKHFPLKLYVFSKRRYDRQVVIQEKPICELLCGYLGRDVKDVENPPCEECLKLEIVSGILVCENCSRWYPIIDEIPRMLPDELRDLKEDREFLERYKDRIPKKVLLEGKPVNLSTSQ